MFQKLTHPLARTALAVAAVLGLLALGQAVMAGAIDPGNKYAWNTSAGWINFAPTNGGVMFVGDHLEGDAYGENTGWIRFQGTAQDGTPYGVSMDGAGVLSGYAWGASVGWINVAPTNGGVTIDLATGDFSGDAYAENIGWIRFGGTAQDGATYQVSASNDGGGSTIFLPMVIK